MQETKFKIDDDLVEYLNAKQDAEKIVNNIIRNMKANEEESLKKDEVKADEHSCEVQCSEKELKPGDMSPKKALLFMILFTVGMILLVSIVKSCSNTKPVKNNSAEFSWSDTDSVATVPEETPVKKTVENKISWDFHFDTDKMTSSKNVLASILSDNSIDLDPPYHSANAKITVRYMKKFGGYDAIISITDGQIYLETELFNAGFRPAINAGLSVSRVGGSAQIKAMKKIAGPIRVELAQYRELASFAQFGSELDEATKNQLAQGERIREILKQPNYKPMAVEYQIVIIFAATKKLLLDVPTEKVLEFQDKLFRFIESKHPEIAAEIRDKKEISDDLAKRLTDVINECKKA